MTSNTKILEEISFANLTNWSVRYLLDFTFNYNEDYELVSIGSFLIRNRNLINVQEEIDYKRVTVRVNNNGVFLRDTAYGKNIGTKKQYIVDEGQFIISKIDARNGALGLIPKELDGAIVTNDFPTFDVDNIRINSQFLLLITTTKTFIKFAQSCSSGTTNRQRINIEQFLNIKIPLPSLEEQNRIVTNYNLKTDLAIKQEQQSKRLEENIESYLFNKLGVSKEEERKKKKGLQIIPFSKIKKWGIDFIEKSTNNSLNFNEYRIKDISKISSGGTPLRSRNDYYKNGEIPWVKTGELENKIIFDTEEKITEEGLKNSSAKLYEKGSLIVAMYGATIGKTAKLGINSATNQACAVLYGINNELVLTDFLWNLLQVQIHNFKKLAYGSAQPNLNAGIIANYNIPIPPIKIQKVIIKYISGVKQQIKDLRAQAKQNQENAIKEFEEEIFLKD